MEANLSPPNPTNGPTALPQCGNRDRILQIVPWEANARKGREFAQRLHHELEARDYKY